MSVCICVCTSLFFFKNTCHCLSVFQCGCTNIKPRPNNLTPSEKKNLLRKLPFRIHLLPARNSLLWRERLISLRTFWKHLKLTLLLSPACVSAKSSEVYLEAEPLLQSKRSRGNPGISSLILPPFIGLFLAPSNSCFLAYTQERHFFFKLSF